MLNVVMIPHMSRPDLNTKFNILGKTTEVMRSLVYDKCYYEVTIVTTLESSSPPPQPTAAGDKWE